MGYGEKKGTLKSAKKGRGERKSAPPLALTFPWLTLLMALFGLSICP